MEAYNARLHSFEKPKSKASSKSSSSRAWPHPDSFVATPTTLADAGFFFKPSKDDPDNVQCFMCKKELGGWDEDDNPFDVHYKKCPKCPWAVARCSLEFDVGANGKFSVADSSRLPTNKVLEKARMETFGGKKWWPHDGVKNHGAASKKMAKAGFVYTPQAKGDDTATCFYCNLALSGWDAEDNPADEHLDRIERSGKPCPFFEATEQPKSQASTRSNKGASRKSRVPKHADTPTDGDDETPTVRAPVKKRKNKGNESDNLSKLSSRLSDAEDSEDLQEDDDPSLKVQPAAVVRKSSRKPPSKSKPPSKAGGRSKRNRTAASKESEEIEQETDAKPARPRTKKGERAKGETDKPPSNVDGKITKSYTDFTVAIDAIEEAKDRDRSRGRAERGRSTSRGRSRSKSRPRSTNASTLVDPQDKPLLRALSRSRISGTTEMEEIETERMLAATPSDTDVEPELEKVKLPSSAERENHRRKGPSGSETEDTLHKLDQPTPRPTSKQGKASAKKTAKKTTAKSTSKKSDPSSSKSVEPVEHDSKADGKSDAQQIPTGDQYMDVDQSDGEGQGLDEDAPEQTAVPTPMSPSDFRPAPSKSAKEGKPASKSKMGHATKPRLPDPKKTYTQLDEDERRKQMSAKMKKPAANEGRPASEQIKKEANKMDVDEDRIRHVRPQSQESKIAERLMISEPVPRPVTPENQIIRSGGPKANTDATDFRNELRVPPSPADMFLPPLANKPIPFIEELTEEERIMTVEQWIRHEMTVQYHRLKEDGETRIRAFLEKAEEMRRQIEAL